MEVRRFGLPEIGPDEALLKVEGSGVCGADWAAFEGSLALLRGRTMVLGHEVVGTVSRIGAAAEARWGLQEGDRVVVEEPIPCGTCVDCLGGSYHWCRFGRRFGATGIDVAPSLFGGYAEYMFLPPQTILHRISPLVPVDEAALFIPLANGLHWLAGVGGAGPGSRVVIQGPGQHGLAAVVAARAVGADCVIVTGTGEDADRLEVARSLGADHILDVDRDDVRGAVREITGRRMADVVVHVAPSAVALEQAVELVAPRGTVVVAGESGDGARIAPDRLIRKEATIRGVAGRPYRAVAAAVRLIESGRHPLKLLCSHTFPFEETELALRTVGRAAGGAPDPLHVTVVSGKDRRDGTR